MEGAFAPTPWPAVTTSITTAESSMTQPVPKPQRQSPRSFGFWPCVHEPHEREQEPIRRKPRICCSDHYWRRFGTQHRATKRRMKPPPGPRFRPTPHARHACHQRPKHACPSRKHRLRQAHPSRLFYPPKRRLRVQGQQHRTHALPRWKNPDSSRLGRTNRPIGEMAFPSE